ncbi:MAG: 50S ribosomal protein L17 [Fidelibacterota bacterium]
MRHQKRVAKLGRTASHRKALMMNLAKSLIQHGKIKTTDAKAKELRRIVERLITYGKRGTVHHRRLAYRILQDRAIVKILFEHIAPQYSERNGGYTRIAKLGFRDHDNAAISLIEFVDYRLPGEKKNPKPAKKETTTKKEKTSAAKPKTKEIKKKAAKKPSPKEVAEPEPEKTPENAEAEAAVEETTGEDSVRSDVPGDAAETQKTEEPEPEKIPDSESQEEKQKPAE